MTTEPVATNAKPPTDPDGEAVPDPGPSIRVGTWNLNNRGPKVAERQGRYAARFNPDLLALQAANPSALPTFFEADGFEWAIGATELCVRPPRGEIWTQDDLGAGRPW